MSTLSSNSLDVESEPDRSLCVASGDAQGMQRDITVPAPRAFVAQSLDLMLFNEVIHRVLLHVDATPWTRTILKH